MRRGGRGERHTSWMTRKTEKKDLRKYPIQLLLLGPFWAGILPHVWVYRTSLESTFWKFNVIFRWIFLSNNISWTSKEETVEWFVKSDTHSLIIFLTWTTKMKIRYIFSSRDDVRETIWIGIFLLVVFGRPLLMIISGICWLVASLLIFLVLFYLGAHRLCHLECCVGASDNTRRRLAFFFSIFLFYFLFPIFYFLFSLAFSAAAAGTFFEFFSLSQLFWPVAQILFSLLSFLFSFYGVSRVAPAAGSDKRSWWMSLRESKGNREGAPKLEINRVL